MNPRAHRIFWALAGSLALGALPALAETTTTTETTVEPGTNGGETGYWVTVKESLYESIIDVVAYYRPYRSRWLDALSRSSFEEAGGRRDNWWQHVNESQVLAAVQKAGWSNLESYVRNNTNADWQNHGVLYLDAETGQLLGHQYVEHSYDAAGRVRGLLGIETALSLNSGTYNVLLKATSVLTSPVILDVHALGRPDLLAGPTWNVLPGRKLASTAMRGFDLDGTGEATWEWVGPKSALLVWDHDGKGQVTSGTQLFGHHTWGKRWKDGYQALAELDTNEDGKVSVNEFANLALWLDGNSNGISEKGEVRSLTSMGIESISVRAQRDAKGNAWAPAGFVRKMPDGSRKTLASWDWMAMGQQQAMEGTYVWVGEMGDKPLGGYFNLHRQGDEIRGFSIPTIGVEPLPKKALAAFPITGKRRGDGITWTVPTVGGTVTSEVTWEDGGKHLFGLTRVNTKDIRTNYAWQADLVAGTPIGPKMRSASKVN